MLMAAGGTRRRGRVDAPDRPSASACPCRPEASSSAPPVRRTRTTRCLLFERVLRVAESAAHISGHVAGDGHEERGGFEPEDLIIALADRVVVGSAFLIDADEIWVGKLAVTSEFRHRGIGSRAVADRVRALVRSGLCVDGVVDRLEDRALLLYRRMDAGPPVVHRYGREPSAPNLVTKRWPRDSNPRGVIPPTRFQACPFGRSGRPPRRVYRGAIDRSSRLRRDETPRTWPGRSA